MSYPKTNEELDISDLARPLSLEAVIYFASDCLPKAKGYESSRHGKFVRIGSVMVIGATLDHGKPDFRGRLHFLQHWQLGNFLRADEELAKVAEATVTDEPQIGGGLTDAGGTYIVASKEGVPTELWLSGNSFDFGRADEAGREKTIEVAQALVSDIITVTQR